MSNDGLKPCPFCGGDNLRDYELVDSGGQCQIFCVDCNGSGPWGQRLSGAENEWNNRASTVQGDLITVCERCLQASCWQGIFCCDNYKNADITQKSRGELKKLNRENPSYWKTDKELSNAQKTGSDR